MVKRIIHFGIIGCGLMGREFASASARWCHLLSVDYVPEIIAVCDIDPNATNWFKQNLPGLKLAVTDYHDLLQSNEVEAVYVALPHNLHQQVYCDVLQADKHLLAEKPFGIDQNANQIILNNVNAKPDLLVRCTSQFSFFPGPYRIMQWICENRFGKIIEVEAGFWHSSDLDPRKLINWKRIKAINGEYGCMGDLGMHVLHIPLRAGWNPINVRAFLSDIVPERPSKNGALIPCDTWDNAILACEVSSFDQHFPMFLSTKRIAPGHANTWFIRIMGTQLSVEFSTQNPKQLRYMPYKPGESQEWRSIDIPYQSAYPTITGSIFEFGFSDSILQMWAAFCDELVHGSQMTQPLRCVLPEETQTSHNLFTAALESQRSSQVIKVR
jgi:predicted dehydrogenase